MFYVEFEIHIKAYKLYVCCFNYYFFSNGCNIIVRSWLESRAIIGRVLSNVFGVRPVDNALAFFFPRHGRRTVLSLVWIRVKIFLSFFYLRHTILVDPFFLYVTSADAVVNPKHHACGARR